jgi:hypothetical protein
MNDILFYGCGLSSGHYLYTPNGERPRSNPTPWSDRALDPATTTELFGGFAPSRETWMGDDEQTEGAAVLSYKDGWTRLGWPDRSVDDRRGSHANLLAKGALTAEQILARGRVAFPWLFKRITYQIAVRRIVGDGPEAVVTGSASGLDEAERDGLRALLAHAKKGRE